MAYKKVYLKPVSYTHLPNILLTVSRGTPCVSVTVVAKVCRAQWIVGLNDRDVYKRQEIIPVDSGICRCRASDPLF